MILGKTRLREKVPSEDVTVKGKRRGKISRCCGNKREAENSALALENENQREQYERCLDELQHKSVCQEFDVLLHQSAVHPHELHCRGLREELLFCPNCTDDYFFDSLLRRESQNMRSEISLLRLQGFPVLNVLGKVHLLSLPEGSLSFLTHLPNIMVFDRKDDRAAGVFFQKWFILHTGGR
eukprot:bmy_16929T0